jgi:neutral ceramidase
MKKWRAELIKKIVNTVMSAHANIQEANLFYGRAPVQIGFNRRLATKDGIVMKPNPRGAVVPWVDVLRADSLDNKPIAVLFSYAAHPVIVHGASAMITADYPGFAVKTVRHNIGKNAVVMFAQGCGANINGEPLMGGFIEAEKAGKNLGAAVLKAIKKSRLLAGSELHAYTLELQLPFRKPPRPETCERTLKTWEEKHKAQKEKNWFAYNIGLELRELLEMARKGGRRCLKFGIQAFAFGGQLCVIGMTHEMFAEYQLWVNKISPFKYNMVFGYTNGCESYIPCEKDFALGGYESGPAPAPCAPLAYRNRLTLEPGIEKQIKAGLRKVFQRLRKEEK